MIDYNELLKQLNQVGFTIGLMNNSKGCINFCCSNSTHFLDKTFINIREFISIDKKYYYDITLMIKNNIIINEFLVDYSTFKKLLSDAIYHIKETLKGL